MTMKIQHIQISETDVARLGFVLAALAGDRRSLKATARLRDELSRAVVVPEHPPDVVGIGSVAEVADLESGEVDRYTLTLPEQADVAHGRLSVLAPLGTALLGFAEGDEFEWEMPGGLRRLKIRRVWPTAGQFPAECQLTPA